MAKTSIKPPLVTPPAAATRKGRLGFMESGKITSLSIEGKLLEMVRKEAYAAGMSVSQWISDAAKVKLARMKRTKQRRALA